MTNGSLENMITEYKNNGDRVDEVLFQEVLKVVEDNQIKTVICRQYDLLQLEVHRLRGLYAENCQEILDLKTEASMKEIFDTVELSDDVKELRLELLKRNVENKRLRDFLEDLPFYVDDRAEYLIDKILEETK